MIENNFRSEVAIEQHLLSLAVNGKIEVFDQISTKFFEVESHTEIGNFIKEMSFNKIPLDKLIVSDFISKRVRIVSVKSNEGTDIQYNTQEYIDYISKLRNDIDIDGYARALKNNYSRRLILSYLPTIEASTRVGNKEFALEKNIRLLTALQKLQMSFFTKRDIYAEAADNSGQEYIQTPLNSLNTLIGGLSLREVSAIGGQPKSLKTTFSAWLVSKMIHKLIHSGIDRNGVIFSAEMPARHYIRKIVANFTDTSLLDMRHKRKIFDAEFIKKLFYDFFGNRLQIIDDAYSPSTMTAILMDLKPILSVVDYIQELEYEDMVLGIIKAVKQFKHTAKEINGNVLLIAQLDDNEKVQWSTYVKKAASEMLHIYYPYSYTGRESERNLFKIRVVTNRYEGSLNTITLRAEPDKARFIEEV